MDNKKTDKIKRDLENINGSLKSGSSKYINVDSNENVTSNGKKLYNGLGYVLRDFTGKKLCRSKSIYKGFGKSLTLDKGTSWESIPSITRSLFNFTEEDFKK